MIATDYTLVGSLNVKIAAGVSKRRRAIIRRSDNGYFRHLPRSGTIRALAPFVNVNRRSR